MKKTVAAIAAVLVLALAGGSAGFHFFNDDEKVTTADFVELSPSDPVTVSVSGRLEAARKIALSTSQNALIDHVNVKYGQQVRANEVLGVLDTSAAERQLNLEEARQAADAANSFAQVQAAQRELNNLNELVNSGLHPELSGTAQAVQETKLAYDQAQDSFNKARQLSTDSNNPEVVRRDVAVREAQSRYLEAALQAARSGITLVTNTAQRGQEMAQIADERREMENASDPARGEVLKNSIADRERAIRDFDAANVDGVFSGIQSVASVQKAALAMEDAQRAYEHSLAEIDANLAQLQNGVDRAFLAQSNAQIALERGRVVVRQQQDNLEAVVADRVRSAQKAGDAGAVSTDQLRMDIGQSEIRTPIDGVITDVRARDGEPAGGKLFEVSDPTRVVIRTEINESSLSQVALGSRVEFTTPLTAGKVFQGNVSYISNSGIPMDDGSQVNYPVEITVTGNTEDLRLGSTARVRIMVDDSEKELIVLPSAVYEDNGNSYVLTIEDGVVTAREVKTKSLDFGIAISGVDEGTLVINDAGKYRGKIGKSVQVERL